MSAIKPTVPTKKSPDEIKFYCTNGPAVGTILYKLIEGIRTGDIGSPAEVESILRSEATGEFGRRKKYPFVAHVNHLGEKFGSAACVSLNDCLCHGRSNSKELFSPGDVVSVDIGISLPGPNRYLIFDCAATTVSHGKELEIPEWINVPLYALASIKATNFLSTSKISGLIEDHAVKYGLQSVIAVSGHGVGYLLHEAPVIYNARGRFADKELFNGLCFCAEPMYVPTRDSNTAPRIASVYLDNDNWSIRTVNGMPATHWETLYCVVGNKLVDAIGITEWKM
jgi:methionine aminopeptidase